MRFFIVFLIYCFSFSSYADEMVGFEEKDLTVLNEQLRRKDRSINDNTSDIATNASDIATNTPSGIIVLWSGAISNIPTGWVICDGNNGTPDLTDRFIIHADADSGGTNDVGDTGGEHSHTLTEAELPSHNHGLGNHTHTFSKVSEGIQGNSNNYVTHATTYGSVSSQTTSAASGNTDNAGSGSAHENRPKYYALAYIMKT